MTKFRLLTRAVFLLTTAWLSASGAYAQSSTTGKVIGTVTDQGDAVVPRAEVQLLNAGTNALSTVSTDESGGYVFPVVSPGTYLLTVKMKGFRTANRLEPGSRRG